MSDDLLTPTELAAMLGTIGESGLQSARDIIAEAHSRKLAVHASITEAK